MKKVLLTLTALVLSISLAACSQSYSDGASENRAEGSFSGEAKGSVSGEAKGDFSGGATGDITAAEAGRAEEPAKTAAPGYIDEGVMDDAEFEGGADYDGVYSENTIPAAAGTLTAGEWIDNDHYTFWKNLFQKDDTGWESYRETWDRSYCSRIFATVAQNGRPVENSAVTLTNVNGEILWQAKTDNEGRAYLFYSASELSDGNLIVKSDFGGEITVSSENEAVNFSIDATETRSTSKILDMALVVDTTGSMSDELSYLQKELENVIDRVAADNGNIPVRLSVDFYRDDGDEYVVRDFDFTENIAEAISNLNEQVADGGGDYPEKVNAALDTAINKLSWEYDSTKLLFIILDAPPHSDDFSAVAQMNELTAQAAEKGIRLIPILASGGDKETEFLMRDFALKTGGSYLFLTDDSGVSVGGHIEPTIGEYRVEKLNDLMVDVTNRYLANVQSAATYVDEYAETSPSESTSEPIVIEPEITVPPTASDGEITMVLTDTLEEGPEPPFEFLLTNNTEYEYNYGYGFSVEKLIGGEWEEIPPTEDFAVIDIAMILAPGDSHIFKAQVYGVWKDLEDGEYRIALNISCEKGTETVYGLFEIK